MRGRYFALTVLVGGAIICAVAAADDAPKRVRYDGHRLVRAYLQNQTQLELMLQLSPDCWSDYIGVGTLDFRVPPENMPRLQRSGIAYDVLIQDLQVNVEAEWLRLQRAKGRVTPRDDWYDDFRDFPAIVTRLNEIAAAHPDLTELIDIGDSIEGRDIWALRITGPGEDKPAVLYNACQHAREWLTPPTAVYIAEQFVNGYGVDPTITDLVDAVEFFVIPVVNPDGYQYSHDVERYWRKNRRDNGDGTFGVDPNRNWDADWGGSGASGYTWDETYYGTAPFSEPETAAMRDFYYAHQNIVASIDFHTHGEWVLSPWGWKPGLPDDGGLHSMIGAEMSAAIKSVHGVTYTSGGVYDLLYKVSGGSIDWTWGDQGVISFTIEERGPDFVVPPSEIIPTCEENWAAALVLAQAATAGVLYSFPYGLPDIIETDVPTPVEITIRPVASGDLDHDSATLYWRVGDAGSFTADVMTYLGDMAYQATLPGIQCGKFLQYYFAIDSVAGETYTSPQSAPDSTYQAQAFDITVYFHDDFESDQGWTVEDSYDLTDGSWDRGIPIDDNRGDPPADADGSGQCYVTGNSDDEDIDGGTTTLYSPIMDASDPEAMISYHRWYSNNYGADPYNDTFLIDVSDDGGATWHTLEKVGPDGPEAGGGWYHKEFVIADIPNIVNSDQFMIRFAASDLQSGSVVEAAVDGVMIRSIGCDEVFGDITGDGVVDVLDLLQLLAAWGPCPGCDEDINGDDVVDVLDLLIVLGEWS